MKHKSIQLYQNKNKKKKKTGFETVRIPNTFTVKPGFIFSHKFLYYEKKIK
jgi:hypothetical protein